VTSSAEGEGEVLHINALGLGCEGAAGGDGDGTTT